MKNSKKLISVSLIVLMLGLVTACGNRNSNNANNGNGTENGTGNAADTNGNTTDDTDNNASNGSNTNNDTTGNGSDDTNSDAITAAPMVQAATLPPAAILTVLQQGMPIPEQTHPMT